MTASLADLQATEARLKANGWSEGNLHWWRRSAYADAGLAVPQLGSLTRSAVTVTKPESGADWAKRLTGKAEIEAAGSRLACRTRHRARLRPERRRLRASLCRASLASRRR